MAKMPISNVVILCGMLVMTRCLGQREELDFPILHSPPSADDFLNMYMEPRIPFVLKNGLRDWPATTLWGSWEKLGNDIGDVVVRVEARTQMRTQHCPATSKHALWTALTRR
mmetsp:Transcript_26956/g.43390  ORF Transcript_26956/g.43390 Transcript_26956/m.43390 type:complete len:112 (-) Transcript_26956:1355-1690(-)